MHKRLQRKGKTLNKTKIICSVTARKQTFASGVKILPVIGYKHSRHISGVHVFISTAVKLLYHFMILTCYCSGNVHCSMALKVAENV